ncbi:metal-dependent hydrolase [Halobacteriales archaeon QS_4_69_31]|nr:MAG: metal-dependent hydrolase [Halobacteriales archaeon QS_4_69_31]
MWPWGHLAAGYLLYSLYARVRTGGPPRDGPALVAAGATQVPDLVDKPLAWSLSVLPTGRSLAHSSVVAALVLPVVWVAAARRDARPLAVAFAVGVVTHQATDALYPVLGFDFAAVTFLAWPLLELPAYEVEGSFAAHLALVEPSPAFLFEVGLVAVASVVWHVDGHPGLSTLRSLPGRLRDAAWS